MKKNSRIKRREKRGKTPRKKVDLEKHAELVRFLERVLALRKEGHTFDEIAEKLGGGSGAKLSLLLHRYLKKRGRGGGVRSTSTSET